MEFLEYNLVQIQTVVSEIPAMCVFMKLGRVTNGLNRFDGQPCSLKDAVTSWIPTLRK